MYYISDKVAVGSAIGFSYAKDKEDGIETKTSIFQIQPTVRYKQPISSAFSYAPEFYFGLGFGSVKAKSVSNFYSTQDVSCDLTMYSVGLKIVRFEYQIVPQINVSFSCGTLGYQYRDIEDVGDSKDFGFGLNLEPTLGFSYSF